VPTSDRSKASGTQDNDRTSVGKALTEILPSSEPPRPVRAKVSDEPPAASFPWVGSDVLEISGAEGAARRDMHDVIHAPDDEITEQRLGPQEEASVSFRADPDAGDAGADFAEEFGRSYLQSVTTGEDISEIESASDLDTSELGGPFLEIDTEGNPVDESSVEETGDSDNVESLDIPTGERGQPIPTSQPPSGEVPRGLRSRGAPARSGRRQSRRSP